MAGIGMNCQSPWKPDHFMVECDPTPCPAPSESCEGSQHGGGKGSWKPEDFWFGDVVGVAGDVGDVGVRAHGTDQMPLKRDISPQKST